MKASTSYIKTREAVMSASQASTHPCASAILVETEEASTKTEINQTSSVRPVWLAAFQVSSAKQTPQYLAKAVLRRPRIKYSQEA